MKRDEQVALFYLFLSIIGYSFLPIFGRMIYPVSDNILTPIDVAFWRFVVATPAIWLMVRFTPSVKHAQADDRQQVGRLLALGFLYMLSAIGAFAGLLYLNASTFTALFYTYPAMVAVISLFMGVRLPLKSWVAIGLVLVGVFLTVPEFNLSGGDTVFLGIIIGLLTALAVAVYYLFIQEVMIKSHSTVRATAWIITGNLISLVLLLPFGGLRLPPNWESVAVLVGLGTISTALPIFWVNIAVQPLGATRTALISSSQPVLTIIMAAVLLGESSTPLQWLGAGLIVLAVVILQWRKRNNEKSKNVAA